MTDPGSGETRSTISGGVFFSAVVQGRDVVLQLPPEITPALSGLPPGTPAFTGRDAFREDNEEIYTDLLAALDLIGSHLKLLQNPPEEIVPLFRRTGELSMGLRFLMEEDDVYGERARKQRCVERYA